jgi:hypothetical protein
MSNKMGIGLIILGGLLLVIGMVIALRTIKPMHFNVIAGGVILIGTLFGLFGKQLQDKGSSEKSDQILKTGKNTNEKIGELKNQNDELTLKTIELKNKMEKQAETIDNLRKENTELYSKLASSSKEIIEQVTGKGFPRLNSIDSPDGRIGFYLKASEEYPIYNLNVGVRNSLVLKQCATKLSDNGVVINRSCYDGSLLYSSNGAALQLNASVMLPINFFLEKQLNRSYFLMTNLLSKHLTAIQYSVLAIDSTGAVGYYYRIYEISKKDNSFVRLLEEVNPDNIVPESIWEQNFFFKKVILVKHGE